MVPNGKVNFSKQCVFYFIVVCGFVKMMHYFIETHAQHSITVGFK
jgi:hypothetical protein